MSIDIQTISTFELLNELRRRYTTFSRPEGRYIFLGPPGSGKGTQAANLRVSHSLCHISTGEVLREAANADTPEGKALKSKLDSGDLVGDDIVLDIVKEKISSPQCRRGFILDGFPRTVVQAQSFGNILNNMDQMLDGVIYFDVAENELEKRVCGRRVHASSGRTYHIDTNPPKVPGLDDETGEPLIQRTDDNPSTFHNRFSAYTRKTVPLVNYYSSLGLLRTIDASKSCEEVKRDMYHIVNKL